MSRMTMMGLVAVAGLAFGAGTAQAQWPGGRVPGGGWGGDAGFTPGRYYGAPGGTNFNPYTGSVYRPWAGTVTRPTGNYFYVPGTGQYTPWGRVPGTGVYQNPWSGGVYNPGSGFYARPW